MDLNMRITRSRGGGIGMTPRDRPPTPRASGAASMPRTPSPNRTRRSASREPTTALQAGMNRYMERLNLIKLQLHQYKK